MGKNEKDKKKYEAPVIVPLGELAIGAINAAACGPGSIAHGACSDGGSANPGEGGCSNGGSPGKE